MGQSTDRAQVTLVNPRSEFLEDDKIHVPLANLYLHAQLKRAGIRARVTDNYSLEDTSWIGRSDFIGISALTPQRDEARRIAKLVKERSDAWTILGGYYPRNNLIDAQNGPFDFIVPRDGERAIVWITEGAGDKVNMDEIKPEMYKAVVIKPERLENEGFLRSFKFKLNGKPATSLLTARGCSGKCTFCEESGTSVRRTPLNILFEEIDDIKKLGYEGVYIFDDIFALSEGYTRPIAEELKRQDLIYRCNGRANMQNEGLLKLLADTGCAEIAFGAESGSQKILDNVRKGTTVRQNYEFVKNAHKYGMKVKAFLMLGLPGENLETMGETEKFIRDSGVDGFQLSIFYPYTGTRIRRSIDKGQDIDLKIEGEGIGAYGQKNGKSDGVVSTSTLSRSDLVEHRDRIRRWNKCRQ